ncbi:MAG TPA: hypothetical protein VMX54_04500 [Vicinamibacteria bacterium]|nr:hypothetical protein [Vicinamibacteria bacterium]
MIDLDELRHLVDEVDRAELPCVLGLVVELEARLRLRLAEPAAPPQREEVEDLITPEAAARIAGLPMDSPEEARRSVRRIYEWARGQRWASRPSRRCLRISERGFRRWLALQASG